MYVRAGVECHVGARHVQAAIGFPDLEELDLVLVESRPAWNGTFDDGIGERTRVYVVAADVSGAQGIGDADANRRDAILLAKCDPLWTVPFALSATQRPIGHRLRGVRLFRVAALEDYGFDGWTASPSRLLTVPRLAPAAFTGNLVRVGRPP